MWSRVFAAWVTLAVLMTLNGIFRVKVLAPGMGAFRAEVASALIGIMLILSATHLFLRRAGALSNGQLIAVSATWVSLTLLFEFIFGHYVDGKSWKELVENYNLARGHLWPLVLAALAASPFLSRFMTLPGLQSFR
jgi:hypothetical protein